MKKLSYRKLYSRSRSLLFCLGFLGIHRFFLKSYGAGSLILLFTIVLAITTGWMLKKGLDIRPLASFLLIYWGFYYRESMQLPKLIKQYKKTLWKNDFSDGLVKKV